MLDEFAPIRRSQTLVDFLQEPVVMINQPLNSFQNERFSVAALLCSHAP